MKLTPTITKFKTAGAEITGALGIGGTIAAVVFLIALAVFAFQGASDGWASYKADREVERLLLESEKHKADAQTARQESAAFKSESDQFKGAAAAYKEQAEAILQQRSVLVNEQKILQQNSRATTKRVENIRNRPIKPIDGNIGRRVDDFSSKLDKLVPDNE